MKPTYVVNLSGVVEYDINKAFAAFTKIYTDYSPSCSPCSPFSFFSALDSVKLKYLFYQNTDLINQYKLGKMTTDDFLNRMLDIFPFLKKAVLDYEDILRITGRKYALMVPLDEKENDTLSFTPEGAKALLELAWTGGVQEINEQLWDSIKNDAEKICFISNTNSMDLNKSLQILLEKLGVSDLKKEIKKEDTDVKIERISEIIEKNDDTPLLDKSRIDAKKMLELLQKKFPKFDLHLSEKGCISIRNSSPVIKIYTSNLYGAFKTPEENKGTTPPLVNTVITTLLEQEEKKENIILLSQYPKDLVTNLLPKENIMTIQNYAKKTRSEKITLK